MMASSPDVFHLRKIVLGFMVWVIAACLMLFTVSVLSPSPVNYTKILWNKIAVNANYSDVLDKDALRKLAENDLTTSTLSEIPYAVELAISLYSRDSVMAEKWLSDAFKVTGRNHVLYDHAIKNAIEKGLFDEVVVKLDTLGRLKESKTEQIVSLLYIVYRTPKGSDKIHSYMAQGVPWGHKLLLKLIEGASVQDLPDLKSLIEIYVETQPDSYKVGLYAILHARQIELGDADEAYDHWTRNLDQQKQNYLANDRIFDSGFSDSQPGPFRWRYYPSEKLIIENADVGQLFISFNGDQKTAVLRQVVNLEGLTQAEFRVTHRLLQGNHRGSKDFEWTILCIESRETLNLIDHSSIDQSVVKLGKRFMVPKIGCNFAEVRLWAEPKSRPSRVSLIVESPQISTYNDPL